MSMDSITGGRSSMVVTTHYRFSNLNPNNKFYEHFESQISLPSSRNLHSKFKKSLKPINSSSSFSKSTKNSSCLPKPSNNSSYFSKSTKPTKNYSSLSENSYLLKSTQKSSSFIVSKFVESLGIMSLVIASNANASEQNDVMMVGADTDLEGAVMAFALFLNKYPLFPLGVSLVVLVIIPYISFLLKRSKRKVTASVAYNALKDGKNTYLVDIRLNKEIKYGGSPCLPGLEGKVVQVPYDRNEAAFLRQIREKFKSPEETTLYVMDMYDMDALGMAEFLGLNGFDNAYCIKDGFEGQQGWQAMEEEVLTQQGASIETIKQDSVVDPPSPASASFETINKDPAVDTLPSASASTSTAEIQASESVSVLDPAEEVKVTVKSQKPPSTKSLSPFSMYPDLKPPTSPTPTQLRSTSPNVAANNGPAISERKVIESIPRMSQPLSPFPWYPDFKPPTSPTPTKPRSNSQAVSSNNGPAVSKENVKESTPHFSHPLSPFPLYPDFKPPTSPTPSKPTSKIADTSNETIEPRRNESTIATKASDTLSSRSPFSLYPDFKPPTSPTPSKPISRLVEASNGNIDPEHNESTGATITSDTLSSRSPFSMYEDLKPPTSPMPSKPPSKTITASVNDNSVSVPGNGSAVTDESVPKQSEESNGGPQSTSRPQSPYASYPDLKPPTSPCPSRP